MPTTAAKAASLMAKTICQKDSVGSGNSRTIYLHGLSAILCDGHLRRTASSHQCSGEVSRAVLVSWWSPHTGGVTSFGDGRLQSPVYDFSINAYVHPGQVKRHSLPFQVVAALEYLEINTYLLLPTTTGGVSIQSVWRLPHQL